MDQEYIKLDDLTFMKPTQEQLENLNKRAIKATNKDYIWEDQSDYIGKHDNIDREISYMVSDELDEFKRILKRAKKKYSISDETIPEPWLKTLAIVSLYDPGRIDGSLDHYFLPLSL